jgi:hypothetical protein
MFDFSKMDTRFFISAGIFLLDFLVMVGAEIQINKGIAFHMLGVDKASELFVKVAIPKWGSLLLLIASVALAIFNFQFQSSTWWIVGVWTLYTLNRGTEITRSTPNINNQG